MSVEDTNVPLIVETRPQAGPLSGWTGVALVVVLLGLAGYMTWHSLLQAEDFRPTERDFICAKTMKHFRYVVKPGDRYPVMSPFSNEKTGFPAEKCYWTRDGKAKREPTYVLLNDYIHKPGPTLCPDCGRLVEPHNPLPPLDKLDAASKAPPARPIPASKP